MYNSFAKYYDFLMRDVDYKARADYLYSLFLEFDKKPSLLLDIACGTGNISAEFAKKGVSVIGVDISEEMLCIAQEKSADGGLDILYLCQDASKLDLYGTVDSAICCLDGLNHITDYEKLKTVFKKVSLFLESGSLFIFDVNTLYKHKNVLSDNTFVFDDGDIYCVWQNEYSDETKITDMKLDFFEDIGGAYKRSTESFSERAYSDDEIISALKGAGLKTEAVFSDMSKSPRSDTDERVIFVTRKLK